MKLFCIEILLFVSINIYSQKFISKDSVFSDSLKYGISLPDTIIHIQNIENQLKMNLKSDFDLKYSLDFNTENKNRPIPYSTDFQNPDFQQFNDTNIFLKKFKTQINQEFYMNKFSVQQFDYQYPNLSGFQKADLFPNQLNVNLFQNKNFSIESSRNSFHTGFEGLNSAGVKLNWQPNERLTLSLQPSAGRYYYGLDVPPNYYGNIRLNIDYKVSGRINLLLNTNYTFAGQTAPYYAPNFYPTNSIYGGIQIQLTNWLSMQGGVNVVRAPNGGVNLLPMIGIPLLDLFKLLGIIKKGKKKPVIPQYWY